MLIRIARCITVGTITVLIAGIRIFQVLGVAIVTMVGIIIMVTTVIAITIRVITIATVLTAMTRKIITIGIGIPMGLTRVRVPSVQALVRRRRVRAEKPCRRVIIMVERMIIALQVRVEYRQIRKVRLQESFKEAAI
jgi:hypothetical protein